jgi:hypothetical protein
MRLLYFIVFKIFPLPARFLSLFIDSLIRIYERPVNPFKRDRIGYAVEVEHKSFAVYLGFLVSSGTIGLLLSAAVKFESVDSLKFALSAFIQSESTLLALCVTLGAILPQVLSVRSRTRDLTYGYFDSDLIMVLIVFSSSIFLSSLFLINLRENFEPNHLRVVGKTGIVLLSISLGSLFPFAKSVISKTSASGQFKILLENSWLVGSPIIEIGGFDYSVTGIDKVISTLEDIVKVEDEITLIRCCYLLIRKCQVDLRRAARRGSNVFSRHGISKLVSKLDSLSEKIISDQLEKSVVTACTSQTICIVNGTSTLEEEFFVVISRRDADYWQRYVSFLNHQLRSVGIIPLYAVSQIQKAMIRFIENSSGDSVDSGERIRFLELAKEFLDWYWVFCFHRFHREHDDYVGFLETNLQLALHGSLNIDPSMIRLFNDYLNKFNFGIKEELSPKLFVEKVVKGFLKGSNREHYYKLLQKYISSQECKRTSGLLLKILAKSLRESEEAS